jgi:hypothetical protein
MYWAVNGLPIASETSAMKARAMKARAMLETASV